jgi:hypothetical protein
VTTVCLSMPFFGLRAPARRWGGCEDGCCCDPRTEGWRVIGPGSAVRVMVSTRPVDFRKGAEGLPSPSTRLPKSNQQRETHLSDGKRESPRFNQAGTCSSWPCALRPRRKPRLPKAGFLVWAK